ncbi:MAG TPA: FAD-dependent oxidoreductase [Lacunisphaera sp.]|nr:FAD-dependent oxidoreductase [Lacunisphaera sp.]
MNLLHYYFPPRQPAAGQKIAVDLCVYGNSPAAITAAIRATRHGHSVALVINSAFLGGLTAGGLGNTDIGNKQAIGGMARDFYRRVGGHYGVAEEWRFEPKVAEKVFREILAEARVQPFMREYPVAVEKQGARLELVRFESGLEIAAKVFIDASYEGDLLALAGISHVVGREGNTEFHELLNGVQIRETHQFETAVDPYVEPGNPKSGLLPGVVSAPLAAIGSGDDKVQAYNFRMCLTQAPDRLPFPRPEGYNPLDYELLARYLRTGWNEAFRKFDAIRGNKTDTNNHGAISTDFIGGSWEFPRGTWKEREEIFQRHVTWQQGLMWFMSHDPRVPATLQAQYRTWGLPVDEFTATGGWSHQLYIRESRRMRSDYVITEHDCRGFVRAEDPVGLGAYAMDSHNCQRIVINGLVRNEGDVQSAGFKPYPISYRAITPRRAEAENLLAPVCLSATHIAYGSIRMEPVFMILGESAASAAHLALSQHLAVQDVPYARLRELLAEARQVVKWPVTDDADDVAVAYEPEATPPPAEPVRVKA